MKEEGASVEEDNDDDKELTITRSLFVIVFFSII